MILSVHSDLNLPLKAGVVYLLKSDNIDVYNMIDDKQNTCFVNLPIKESIKVIPYFDKISKIELDNIKDFLLKEFEIKIRDENFTGKLIISILKLINQYKNLIIELSGLSYDSIDFLTNFLKLNFAKYPTKRILLFSREKPKISQFDFSVL